MFYDRKIKYVDVYEKGEKVQNAGFARIEVRGEEVFLHLQISKLRSTDTCKCPVALIAGKKEARLGEIVLEGGKGTWESGKLDVWKLGDDIEYTRLQEIEIKLPGERILRCIVQENVEEENTDLVEEIPFPKPTLSVNGVEKQQELVGDDSLEGWQKMEKQDEWRNQAELQQESRIPDEQKAPEELPRTEALPVQRTGIPLTSAGKWQQLLAIYPHIRPFEDMREYLMIKPGDLVILQEKFFGLSGNSFLLHGYYNYEHLILAKEERGNKELYYIGVPGNFYHKEKQVAVLFGFESFEGKAEPARNGDFGYYMIPVDL